MKWFQTFSMAIFTPSSRARGMALRICSWSAASSRRRRRIDRRRRERGERWCRRGFCSRGERFRGRRGLRLEPLGCCGRASRPMARESTSPSIKMPVFSLAALISSTGSFVGLSISTPSKPASLRSSNFSSTVFRADHAIHDGLLDGSLLGADRHWLVLCFGVVGLYDGVEAGHRQYSDPGLDNVAACWRIAHTASYYEPAITLFRGSAIFRAGMSTTSLPP